MRLSNLVRTAGGPGAFALILLASTGCDLTRPGQQGNFYFAYAHPGVWALGTDLAVGTRAQVGVWADENRDTAIDLSDASFDPSGVLAVQGTHANTITIEAQAAGTADLSVTSADDEIDTTSLSATEPDTVAMRFPNPFNLSDGNGVFVHGGTALVPFDLKAGDATLIGYGLPGFSADPPSAATFVDPMTTEDVYFLHVTFDQAGSVTLKHDLAEDFPVTVVEPSDISTLSWQDFGGSDSIPVGTPTVLFLKAEESDGTLVFGLQGLVTVASSTHDVCTVRPSDLWGDGTWAVDLAAEGTCTVTATLGDLQDTWTGTATAGG